MGLIIGLVLLLVIEKTSFTYLGLQYGKWCHCSNKYGKFNRTADSQCNYNCSGNTGDATEKCGGHFKNAVYKILKTPKVECWIYGNNTNFDTTDGYSFEFDGDVPCIYTLMGVNVQYPNDTRTKFYIKGKLVDCTLQSELSCLKQLKIEFKGKTWYLELGGDVKNENGSIVYPYIWNDIAINDLGDNVQQVVLSNGVVLSWKKRLPVTIKVPTSYKYWVNGLCGQYDGQIESDYPVNNPLNQYKENQTCPP